MALTKQQRAQVKALFDNHCAYCGVVLGDKWHADHFVAIRRDSELVPAPVGSPYSHVSRATGTCANPELDCIENMMPSCSPCNLYKGGNTLEGWREQLQELNRKLNDYSKHFRFAKLFGLVQETEQPIIFYFEKVSIENE